jgi:hypothetical protein
MGIDVIRFYNENLIDTATATPSTVNSLFPVANIKDARRTKVFRSTTNSDNIVFNFGSAKNINSIFIVDNILTGFGITALTLQLNSSDSWGSPAFTQVLTLNTEHGTSYADFATQSYQYARIVFTSSLSYCEISNLFIGESLAIGDQRGINYGWTYQDRELSRITENRYSQKFVDQLPRQRQIGFQFTNLNKDEIDDIFEIYDSKSTTSPFFMRLGCDDMSNDFERFSGMFYLNSVPTITNTNFNKYSISIQIEEAT